MNRPLRALIIEDDEDDALLLLWNLKQAGFEPFHERVDTLEALTAALERQTWDILISDNAMPRFSALDALGELKKSGLAVPFLIVSGTMDPVAVEAALKAGASGYILKDEPERLAPAVESALRKPA